ncbi:MAG: hypothetical protein JNK11_13135 [Alphaproteobacteria bacterium]|nr:hypothetical protein [Alphaproteobacteria bacterium]
MHLVIDISGHGLGHATQVMPVAARLQERLPSLRLTLRTAVPEAHVRTFGAAVAEVLPAVPDVGLANRDPMTVDADASAERYAALHADWPGLVETQAKALAALRPTAMLANVPHLSMAAARRAGVPAIALSSVNWGVIYRAFCGARPEAGRIADEIESAYAGADAFIQVTPHLDMPSLGNAVEVGPIGRVGADRRDALRAAVGAAPGTDVVLAAFGGIAGWPIPGALPVAPGIAWIVPERALARAGGPRADLRAAEATGLAFVDLLASVDVVVTRAGYGTIVEAALAGARLVAVAGGEWPEEPGLFAWAAQNAATVTIARARLPGNAGADGDLVAAIRTALDCPLPPRPLPTGIDAAAAHVARRLGAS